MYVFWNMTILKSAFYALFNYADVSLRCFEGEKIYGSKN